MTNKKREPFAGVELESEEIGWLVKVAGETICSGDGFWEKLDAEQMAARINAAHEARVKEAVEEFRERVANHIRSECIACQGTGQTKRGIDQRNKNVSLPVARGASKKGKK